MITQIVTPRHIADYTGTRLVRQVIEFVQECTRDWNDAYPDSQPVTCLEMAGYLSAKGVVPSGVVEHFQQVRMQRCVTGNPVRFYDARRRC